MTRFQFWSYLVLTHKQRELTATDQAKGGIHRWAMLRKRMVRQFGEIKYIQTWERHQKKGYHLNIAISNQRIQSEIASLEKPWNWPWLRQHAEECGFGYICWAEPLRADDKSLAGYLTKLSRELTGAGPKNQVPVDAPHHFRRLRASVRLLPPPFRGDYTGQLVSCSVDSWERLIGQVGQQQTNRSPVCESGGGGFIAEAGSYAHVPASASP